MEYFLNVFCDNLKIYHTHPDCRGKEFNLNLAINGIQIQDFNSYVLLTNGKNNG